MKKHFISTFAALLLSATMLTACGDDVQMPEKDGTEPEISMETTASTLFSTAADDGTRTWMDTERHFYWSNNDQIYVNTTGTTYQKTNSSTIANDSRTADFVLEGVVLTEPKCSLMYIGNGMTAAAADKDDLKVKIASTQTQSAWDNSDHLGASGDCGMDVATRDEITGKYTFTLKHKAAYLIFQPYCYRGNANPDWKLMKIEIIANGTTLAGEYSFGTGELVGTGSSNTITLNCGTGGFGLNYTSAWEAISCFAVIQPGSHELTIRYTVKVTKKANVIYYGLTEDGIFTVEKKIATRLYSPNGVTTIKHRLEDYPYHYQWGASDTYLNTYLTEDYDKTTDAPTQLDMTTPVPWGELPNANELYWYVAYGDPRWDGTTVCSPNGGLNEYTGGIWLKKKQYITGFSSTVGMDGVDMRTTLKEYINNSATYTTAGKPADSVIDQYFFLPALGWYGAGSHTIASSNGYYWSQSPCPGYTSHAYNLSFYNYAVEVTYYRRNCGFVVIPGWFQ